MKQLNIKNGDFNPDFELKDNKNRTIEVFKPKIIVVIFYIMICIKNNIIILIRILNDINHTKQNLGGLN